MTCISYESSSPFSHFPGPTLVIPLISQPLLELALSIPTYTLVTGGRDRGLARRAFSNDLPQELLARRTKSSSSNLLFEAYCRNKSLAREILLNGLLVREGLLQRDKVEEFFNRACDCEAPGFVDLFVVHLELELWLQSWHRRSDRTAPMAA